MREGERRGGELKCYIHTDIQTYRHTDRASDEAGPRGAFAPNKSYNYNSNNHFPLRTLGKPQKKVLLLMAIKRGGGKGRAIKEKITFQHSNGH